MRRQIIKFTLLPSSLHIPSFFFASTPPTSPPPPSFWSSQHVASSKLTQHLSVMHNPTHAAPSFTMTHPSVTKRRQLRPSPPVSSTTCRLCILHSRLLHLAMGGGACPWPGRAGVEWGQGGAGFSFGAALWRMPVRVAAAANEMDFTGRRRRRPS